MTKTNKFIVATYVVLSIAYGASHDLKSQVGFSGSLSSAGSGSGSGGASVTVANTWTQRQTFQNGITVNPNTSSQQILLGPATTSGLKEEVATFSNAIPQTVPNMKLTVGDGTNLGGFWGRYLQLQDSAGQHNAGIIFEGNAQPIISTFPPTVNSGFGTSPTITDVYGGAFAFTVNVGTGGVATSGVLTMPATNSGGTWICFVSDETSAVVTRQTASTSTTVTVTGASAWTAADKLRFICAGAG